jgi:hypothetical protein
MRTDKLVDALVADQAVRPAPLARTLVRAMSAAFLISLLAFAFALGPRDDVMEALGEPRFVFKFVVVLLLAATAGGLVLHLMRPEATAGIRALALAAAPVLLAAGVIAELIRVPSPDWMPALVGSNWLICLTAIPLLALPLLVAALYALRHGAPTRTRFAGAAAGLLAGGLAAALYGAHCTDDSPLFVATWYGIAIGTVVLLGGFIGPRVLRW